MEHFEKILQQHAELFLPTTEELQKLKTQEQDLEYSILPPIGISEGRQSRVSILEYKTRASSDKVIWKRMGAGKKLESEEAELFKSRLLPYQKILRNYGWLVPNILHYQIVPINDEFQIFSYEKLISGGDAETMFLDSNQPNFKKWFVLRSAISILATHPESELSRQKIMGQELSILPYGLDLKLANLVLDDSEDLYFVDLFGPKELTENGDWLTYSSKLDLLSPDRLKAVTASREGAILRLYRLAEKMWLKNSDKSSNTLREEFLVLIKSVGLPENEIKFIESELKGNFNWLDTIYLEKSI